jgi:hypothetical protein
VGVLAILRNSAKCGMDDTMNHSGNHIPIVQASTSWRERRDGYWGQPAGSRRRAWLMVLAGFSIGVAVDVCFFDESLFAMLARSLA